MRRSGHEVPREPPLPGDLLVRCGLFAVLALGVHALIAWTLTPGVFAGGLTEPDGFMRLVRVQRLWDTRAWFDSTVPRANAPFGDVSHWTRPFDVWLLAGAAPLSMIMPFRAALHAWAVASTPVLLVLTAFGALWAVRPLVPSPARTLVMVALLVQPGVMSYALPGRADHHMAVLLVFVWSFGAVLRVLVEPGRRRPGLAGTALAVGLWLTTEFLVVWGAALVGLTVAWIVEGGEAARRARHLMGWLTGATLACLLVERGAGLGAVEYDRISIAHVALAGLGFATWVAVESWGRRVGAAAGALRRGVAVAAAGTASLAVLLAGFGGFFQGPWADLDPESRRFWFATITELQPVLPAGESLGTFVAYLGPALLSLPFVAWRLARERGRADWTGWVFVAALLVVYTGLSVRSLRFTPFAGVMFAFVIVAAVDAVPAKAASVRVGATVLLLGGFLVVGGFLTPAGELGSSPPHAACRLDRLADALPGAEEGGPLVIVAHPDYGPELLYWTAHAVVATPYHRSVQAVRDVHRILASADEEESRHLLEGRQADLVLLCPAARGGDFGRRDDRGAPTLYSRLFDGTGPAWLRPEPLAVPGTEGFLLFEMIR